MERKSERIPVMIEPSLLEKIDDFRFEARIGSRSRVIRELIHRGIKDLENEKADAQRAS